MTTLTGVVERITYHNPENGYTVLRFSPDFAPGEKPPGVGLDGLLTVVGLLPEVAAGERLSLEGDFTTHPKHGLQFKVSGVRKELPVSKGGIERYLGSGMIKGIGPELAKRIVRHFGTDTLEVIEKTPRRLREVPGIGPDRMKKVIAAWEEQKQVQDLMLFLHEHHVSNTLAVKIHQQYGEQALELVRENPYRLEQDIYGVGFRTADKIARDLGLPPDHPSRIEAGIIYALNNWVEDGHVFVPESHLKERAVELLKVNPDLIPPGLTRLAEGGRIQIEPITLLMDGETEEEVTAVYLTPYYHAEKGLAACLRALLGTPVVPRQSPLMPTSENLSEEQRKVLEKSLASPVSVITGGPGTGKTTCLKALIQLLEMWGVRYALASPTGRAAKRLSEATERPASTIHRLLGYSPVAGVKYHEKKPLNIEFLVVDEASMLDVILAYQLLRAVKQGTQVLFVGDVDQLPSVGAGDVLRDLITSGVVTVSRLTKIYRQAAGSDIIANAHRINRGELPAFSKAKTGDFFLFPADDAEGAADWVLDLVTNRIPEIFGFDPVREIQVLTPMYRGGAGVDALNQRLQAGLNPAGGQKIEQKLPGRLFREGDKVMQIRNNYDKDVYNGDIGFIQGINRIDQTLTVMMDGIRPVIYEFPEADELVLAYAVSVHKAQGSEFPVVVMPVLTQHYVMLQRNLVYTGVTRAEKLCVIVGNPKALRIAINNNKVSTRFSGLANQIRKKL